jgi:hypothetical protein
MAVLDIVSTFCPDGVDASQLLTAKSRAQYMLQNTATLELTPEDFGVTLRVTNQTGHKLPSGYPEGRRMWLNLQAYDSAGALVYESGAYNPSSGVLTHDEDAKIHPGLSPGLAGALGLAAGKTFHFVLNDTVYYDNRIRYYAGGHTFSKKAILLKLGRNQIRPETEDPLPAALRRRVDPALSMYLDSLPKRVHLIVVLAPSQNPGVILLCTCQHVAGFVPSFGLG